MQKNEKNKVVEVISDSINDITDAIKEVTTIENAITINDNLSIIPVTKTTFGFVNGGGEYGEIKLFNPQNNNVIGGSGAVINVTPYGFLVVKNNDCTFIKTLEDNLDKIAGFTKDMIDNIVGAKNEKN